MSTLSQLAAIREAGMAPVDCMIYLGIGFRPPKQNAIEINPERLPSAAECHAVAGLDVMLIFHGHEVRYGVLRELTRTLQNSQPRRLQLIDIDHKCVAYLKLAGL